MTESDTPKILIVNAEPIATRSATGITLGNLFAGWPSNRLAQVFTSSLPHERRSDLEYLVAPGERRGLQWLKSLRCSRRSTSPAPATGRQYVPGVAPRRKEWIRPALRNWLDLVPYQLPPEIEKAMIEFRPEVVYTCLASVQISTLALHCATLANAAIVPHFMDDWLSTMYADSPGLFMQRSLLLRTIRQIMSAAPFGIGISDSMADEYAAKFGIPFHSFMNSSSIPEQMVPPPVVDPAEGVRFIYVGGLHLKRWRSLKEVGEALASLADRGLSGKLHIYSPAADLARYGDRLANRCIVLAGALAQDQVSGVLAGGHVLVHVESFDPTIRKYSRLSISTKIPQYMAAGRPLFCYGPGEIASLGLVESEACGLIVGKRDRDQLEAELRKILVDVDLRAELAERGLAAARRKFDSPSVRERFRRALASAARLAAREHEEEIGRPSCQQR